ncbi:MAG: flavodoxin domain-containing protein [Bifidobacteriaceae bacterium]|jgi:menaquinone-dependent protoporphyrinogen oxidase|nr:flavodoxin domain-containing protein [Bifidobacteriaceae bacterium]
MKALIAVASKHGSTLQLGRRIAEVLQVQSIATDLIAAEKVSSLRGYDLVVLGSAVYANKMMPAMTALAYRWRDQLPPRPTYLFCSGPLGSPDPSAVPLPREARDLVNSLAIRSARMFGGCLSFDRLRPPERAWARMFGTRSGDYRDWVEVEAWAASIADQMERCSR